MLSLNKSKITSYGLSSFFNVSAKLQNALPDLILKKNRGSHFVQRLFLLINISLKYCVFSYVPVYAMYLGSVG